MIQDKWLTIRSIKEHAQDGDGITRPTPRASEAVAVSSDPPKRLSSYFLPWRRAAVLFALLSVVLFSSSANGQLPTVTALPYLLTNDGLPNAPIVVTSFPVIRVPPAVASSNIGSLLGGGLKEALTVGIGSSSEAAAAAVAVAGARKIQALRTVNAANKIKQDMQQDAAQGKANEQAQLNQTCPLKPNAITPNAIKPNAIKSSRYLRAKASRQLRANARQLRANSRGQLRANDASLCSTQEDEADAAEEQLEELTEVGNASEEAIEGAEEAAEAAEVAAEAAEEAAEGAEIAIDIFESILDALAIF